MIDVGCIECGEQTEVVGVYGSKEAAEAGFKAAVAQRDIKDWEPRGGFLEFFGPKGATSLTSLSTGYFKDGQHALEMHQWEVAK